MLPIKHLDNIYIRIYHLLLLLLQDVFLYIQKLFLTYLKIRDSFLNYKLVKSSGSNN